MQGATAPSIAQGAQTRSPWIAKGHRGQPRSYTAIVLSVPWRLVIRPLITNPISRWNGWTAGQHCTSYHMKKHRLHGPHHDHSPADCSVWKISSGARSGQLAPLINRVCRSTIRGITNRNPSWSAVVLDCCGRIGIICPSWVIEGKRDAKKYARKKCGENVRVY